MIRTKQPQNINPKNRHSDIVYFEAGNRSDDDVQQTVTFDVKMFTFKTMEKEHQFPVFYSQDEPALGMNGEPVLDGNGDPVMHREGDPIIDIYLKPVMETGIMIYPGLYHFATEKAVFKKSTFREKIGEVWNEDYDQTLIQQIAYVNTKQWSGNEIMQTYYWNLGVNDFDVMTPQQLVDLLQPYRKTT